MGALKGQMNDFCTLLVSLNIANVRNRTSNNTGNLQDVASGLPSGGISRTYSLTERQQMFDNTKFASQVISTTGYILFYILLVLVCLFARKVRGMRTFSRSRGHFVFILTGALFSIVTIFSVDNLVLEWVSRIIIFCSSAGPFLIYGSLKYFMQPNKQTYRITQTPELNDSKTETHNSSNPLILSPSTSTTESEQLISSVHEEGTEVESARKRITDSSKIQGEAPLYGDAKLEHVIGFVTFLLVAMETFIIFALVKESVSTNPILESTGRILDVFQKVITAIVYAYVCKKIVHPNFKVEAIMYLKIFSLINLTFWVDTLANIDTSLMFTLATSVYGPAFKIAETIYEALLTDYRLLLAFLLLEHASHLEHNCPLNKENKCVGMPSGKVAVPVLYRSLEEEQARYIGYIIGFVLIIVQMIWGLQYVSQLGLAPVVHSLALVVHVSFILLSSAFLKANSHLKHAEVSSIDVMVSQFLFQSLVIIFLQHNTNLVAQHHSWFITMGHAS